MSAASLRCVGLLLVLLGSSCALSSAPEDSFNSSQLAKHPFQLELSAGEFRYSQFGSPDFPVLTGTAVCLEKTCCGVEIWRGVVGRENENGDGRRVASEELVYFRIRRGSELLQPRLEISSDRVTFFENGWTWLDSRRERAARKGSSATR